MGYEIPPEDQKEVETYLDTLRFLNESTDDYLYLWDFRTGRIYFAGPIYKKYRLQDKGKTSCSVEEWGSIVYGRDLPAVQENLTQVAQGKLQIHNMEYRLIDREGNRVWISCRGKSQLDDKGRPKLMIGRVSDTVLGRKVDNLTGLLNASRFNEDLNECLKEGRSGYLLILGIDNLKNINIKYGRDFGNQIIKLVTDVLEKVVDWSFYIYRLDGDHFAVNLTGQDQSAVENIYREVQKRVSAHCTISAGSVPYTDQLLKDGDRLYQYAENALDRAKKSGKNRLLFFSAKDFERRLSMIELQDELRNSIQKGFSGFHLCYQPQISGETFRICGAETLLRYTSPSRGEVSPEEFIPVLEQTQLIVPVGLWVLEHSLLQCKEWREQMPEFHISVNISYVQLRKEGITEDVLDFLEKVDLPGEALTLEVTESMHLQNYQYFNKIFYKWKKAGIAISVDDFGTGYSSLSHLKSIEINEIKIDRCFVSGIQHSAYNYRLLSNIIELANTVQIKVCCEGVETLEELAVLKELRPKVLQGYLFAKPYTKEKLEEIYFHKDSPAYKERCEKELYYQDINTGKGKQPQVLPAVEELGGIVENMDEAVYVSDTNTYELYYLNPAGRSMTGMYDYKGRKCYKVLQGRNTPCDFCTNLHLKRGEFYVWEMHNSFLNRHFIIKDKLISWRGKTARMEIAIDITERENVSQSVKEKLDFEKTVVACTKMLAAEEDMEQAVLQVLASIGEFYKADRVYIFEPGTREYWKNTYEWCRNGVSSEQGELQNVPCSALQRWLETFEQDRSIIITDLDLLGEDNHEEWEILQRQNIRRLIATPIWQNRKIIGFIGTDNSEHRCEDDDLIRTMSLFLADRLKRKETEERLNELLSFQRKDMKKKRELAYEMEAKLDYLTDVLNRRTFEYEATRFAQGKGNKGAIILLDLDDFKEINDQKGHLEGDKVLKNLASVLTATFRSRDLVGRLGGDEFLVLIKDVWQKDILDKRMEEMFQSLQHTSQGEITCSAGITFVSGPNFSYENSLKEADTAMLKSKRAGKNTYMYYEGTAASKI